MDSEYDYNSENNEGAKETANDMISALSMAGAVMPDDHKEKQLKACSKCRLIMSNNQWGKWRRKNGDRCYNSEHPSHFENKEAQPTPYFNGIISLCMPGSSWVAKWNELEGLKPGIYAITIMDGAYDLEYEMEETRPRKARRNKANDDYSDDEELPGSEYSDDF